MYDIVSLTIGSTIPVKVHGVVWGIVCSNVPEDLKQGCQVVHLRNQYTYWREIFYKQKLRRR